MAFAIPVDHVSGGWLIALITLVDASMYTVLIMPVAEC